MEFFFMGIIVDVYILVGSIGMQTLSDTASITIIAADNLSSPWASAVRLRMADGRSWPLACSVGSEPGHGSEAIGCSFLQSEARTMCRRTYLSSLRGSGGRYGRIGAKKVLLGASGRRGYRGQTGGGAVPVVRVEAVSGLSEVLLQHKLSRIEVPAARYSYWWHSRRSNRRSPAFVFSVPSNGFPFPVFVKAETHEHWPITDVGDGADGGKPSPNSHGLHLEGSGPASAHSRARLAR